MSGLSADEPIVLCLNLTWIAPLRSCRRRFLTAIFSSLGKVLAVTNGQNFTSNLRKTLKNERDKGTLKRRGGINKH